MVLLLRLRSSIPVNANLKMSFFTGQHEVAMQP